MVRPGAGHAGWLPAAVPISRRLDLLRQRRDHLVGVEELPAQAGMLQLEHFAFNAVGLKDF